MRIFVAIFPPPEVQETLTRAARKVPIDGDVRWVRQENVHLTLKFLGEIGKEILEGIRTVLGEVARRHEPLRIQPHRLGAFPSNKKARILWAGVDEGSTGLSNLAADIEEALEPLGFGRERKVYVPHATLGRVRGRPARLPEEYGVRTPEFTARGLDLVESTLDAGGATYEKLESYPLAGNFRPELSNRKQRPDSHNDKEEYQDHRDQHHEVTPAHRTAPFEKFSTQGNSRPCPTRPPTKDPYNSLA